MILYIFIRFNDTLEIFVVKNPCFNKRFVACSSANNIFCMYRNFQNNTYIRIIPNIYKQSRINEISGLGLVHFFV